MRQVWRTRGPKFHARPDCESLLAGQEKASAEGKPTYAPVLTPLKDIEGDYRPCLTCWKDEPGWFDGWLNLELQVAHHSGQADGSDWERVFLTEVLEKLPRLMPSDVTAQDIVQRTYGAPLRPDFTIKIPGLRPLAIEVDGDKKRWYPDAASREDSSKRDDELETLGFRVLHFTNTQVTQDTEWCRNKLDRVLSELEAEASTRTAAASAGTLTSPGAPSEVSLPSPPPARPWLKWGAVGLAAAVVAVIAAVWVGLAGDHVGGGVDPTSGGQCDRDHPVKGNVSDDGERIYHEPGWQYYELTRAEECFANDTAAEDAGYRASQRR